MKALNSWFWTLSGAIYFLAVVLRIGRKPRPPKPTPPEVLEYEAWVKERLAELYRERAERVEAAFAPRHALDMVTQKHPGFGPWIQLLPNGEVRLAGRIFHAKETFQAVAKDDRDTERAVVSGNGDGSLCIISHGVTYQAIWTGTEWRVEEIQTGQLGAGT